MTLWDRPVRELVVILGTVALMIVLVSAVIGVFVIEIINPETDTANAASFIGHAVSALLAGVVGFIVGRRQD